MTKKNNEHVGQFEELVLLAILKLGDGAYGGSIHEALEAATGRRLSIGALYTTLSRLEAKEMVTSRESEPTAERGGRVRRYYKLEEIARRLLREADTARRNLA